MALSQIAFDFGEPQQPAVVSKPVKHRVVKAMPEPVPVVQTKSARGRKSIAAAAADVHLVSVPKDDILFQKAYYSMGEVVAMFRVNAAMLRLWENNFEVLKPRKNDKGDRRFRPEDVKMLQLIYHLIREKKYTMQGAKDFINQNKKAQERFALVEDLKKIKDFLLELQATL